MSESSESVKSSELRKEEGSLIEGEIVEERVYIVPIYKALRKSRGLHRAKKAVNFLRKFIIRHMKNPNVKISPEVNEIIWSRGIRNPPRRIKVRVVRTKEEEVWVLKARE